MSDCIILQRLDNTVIIALEIPIDDRVEEINNHQISCVFIIRHNFYCLNDIKLLKYVQVLKSIISILKMSQEKGKEG